MMAMAKTFVAFCLALAGGYYASKTWAETP